MDKIKIGIVGYGNIGRGVELAIERNEDMQLKAVLPAVLRRRSRLPQRVFLWYLWMIC